LLIRTQGCGGSSVTAVPTEYRRRRLCDTALLTVEVDHLTRQEMNEKIRTALEDFRQPYLPENKDVEDDSMTDASAKGHCVLKSLFGHQRASVPFLRNMDDGGGEKILSQLLSWLDEIEWPLGWQEDNKIWRKTASTPGEYQLIMQQLHISGIWVFIDLIR
jgi:hypothetical protein